MRPTEAMPPRHGEVAARLLVTGDLLGTVVPLPATYGMGGSVHGVRQLLETERTRRPALWLDTGDLTVGGPASLWGDVALDDIAALPISAVAVGNHDLDGGLAGLQATARRMPFPLLSTDRALGVPRSVRLDVGSGLLGLVAVSHPATHLLSGVPPLDAAWADRVREEIMALRANGATWVVALLHEGVTWWPQGNGVGFRTGHLEAVTAPWARQVDAILTGHTLAAWRGTLHGVPAGQAHAFGASVLPVDLLSAGGVVLHDPVRVPQVAPPASSRAARAIAAAGAEIVATLDEPWIMSPGAERYLPDLVAEASRLATGAEAAIVPPSQLFTQAPIDGVVAALAAGPVTVLDLCRLAPYPPNDLIVAEFRSDELRNLIAGHDARSHPSNQHSDALWWNWARMPMGAAGDRRATSVAMKAFLLPLIEHWLQREVTIEPSDADSRVAIADAIRLSRHS